jgi:hypothetical protein
MTLTCASVRITGSSREQLRSPLPLIRSSLYITASCNSKFTITHFSCPFLSAIFTNTNSYCFQFIRVRNSYHHHHHHLLLLLLLPSWFRPMTCSVQKFNFQTYESIRTVGRTPWTGDQPDSRPLPTQDNTMQKKRGHTSMPRTIFEPAIPMFERPKTVRASDRSAIGTGEIVNI